MSELLTVAKATNLVIFLASLVMVVSVILFRDAKEIRNHIVFAGIMVVYTMSVILMIVLKRMT